MIAAACTTSDVTATSTTTAAPSAAASGSASAAAGTPPTLAAVTAAGAVVLLDPANGQVTRTLVTSGAVGDQISLTPDAASVYYENGQGCQHEIWRVPTAGGAPVKITGAGSTPAVSPDGTALAYSTQDFARTDGSCPPGDDYIAHYQVIVLELTTRRAQSYPMPPGRASSGLPAPVDHLSWSPDGSRLLVSESAAQDNEGWALHVLDPARDRAYVGEDDSTDLPLPGAAPGSFYRQGVYLPNGHLFAVRQCCGGWPPQTTAVDLVEIDQATGGTVRQVAVGLTDRDHTSLAASADGRRLLYLSGSDLEVAVDGAKPAVLTTGILAATW